MKPLTDLFTRLPKTESPKLTVVEEVPYVLHEDHRWLLPIAQVAQSLGHLPKPCTVVMFDRHHDALPPSQSAKEEIKTLRAKPNLGGLIALCANSLRKTDDDWLKAGMDLGLFGDAVIFGVEDRSDAERLRDYRDVLGGTHRIEMPWLPRSGLAHHGQLNDLCRRSELAPLWNSLGWESSDQGFRFLSGIPKILLTIDLDCFAIVWGDYTFQWPTIVFESEFLKPSNDWRSEGWTGKSFLQGLAQKAGLVTIEREAGCSGGEQESQDILKHLIHYGFEDSFSFES